MQRAAAKHYGDQHNLRVGAAATFNHQLVDTNVSPRVAAASYHQQMCKGAAAAHYQEVVDSLRLAAKRENLQRPQQSLRVGAAATINHQLVTTGRSQ